MYQGTRPSEWFYDSSDYQWYYIDSETNTITSEWCLAEYSNETEEINAC